MRDRDLQAIGVPDDLVEGTDLVRGEGLFVQHDYSRLGIKDSLVKGAQTDGPLRVQTV